MEKKRFFIFILNQVVAHFLKVSLIIGSPFLFFSAANCIIPLSGLFAGMGGFIISYLVYLIKTVFFSKTIAVFSFVGILTLLRLPTLIASLYVFSENAFLRTIVSLFCIILFLLHSDGMHAPLYTMIWFIPLLVPLVIKDFIYLRFLYATLLQHAVGSVLFLYQNLLTAAEWNALIPTVFCERILFSVGMYISYVLLIGFVTDDAMYQNKPRQIRKLVNSFLSRLGYVK